MPSGSSNVGDSARLNGGRGRSDRGRWSGAALQPGVLATAAQTKLSYRVRVGVGRKGHHE